MNEAAPVDTTDATPQLPATVHERLAAAQGELKDPKKTREVDTGKYKYRYADLSDVLAAVRPVFSKHGLAVTQATIIRDGQMLIETKVSTIDGDAIKSEYPVCSLNGNHQAMGAALTYARRYALTTLIGLSAVDDTDGQGAAESGEGPRPKMSVQKAKKEINWETLQETFDNAKDLPHLNRLAADIDKRKGYWPDSYIKQAHERLAIRRAEIIVKNLEVTIAKATTDEQRHEIWNEADIPARLQDFPDHARSAFDIYNQSLDGDEQ